MCEQKANTAKRTKRPKCDHGLFYQKLVLTHGTLLLLLPMHVIQIENIEFNILLDFSRGFSRPEKLKCKWLGFRVYATIEFFQFLEQYINFCS